MDIEKIKQFVNNTTKEDWQGSYKLDPSAKIMQYKGKVQVGDYFLCDCIGNTIDLCKKTNRAYRNDEGRLVYCIVIETLIPDCQQKFGTALNGVWVIPADWLN